MALKAIISSVDEVDEALRGLYVEKDEKFFLDVESVGGYSLEDVSGLKSALSRKTEESRQRGAKLKTFDGLDPGEAREAIEKLVEFGKEPDIEAKIKEGIAVREKQRAEQHKKEMSEKDERSSHLLSQLEEHLITANVTKAISEKKGNVELLTPHIKKFVRMVEGDNGAFSTQVLEGDFKTPRMSLKTGSQDMMSISELVDDFSTKDAFMAAFEGSGASGSGAKGTDASGKSSIVRLIGQDALNPQKYRAAKAEAEKRGVPFMVDGD